MLVVLSVHNLNTVRYKNGNHQEVSGKFNVQIRKKGYPFISKSFISFTVAKKWATTTEADMERHVHVAIPDHTTVGELLERYRKEILPTHKGSTGRWIWDSDSFGVFGGFEIDAPDP